MRKNLIIVSVALAIVAGAAAQDIQHEITVEVWLAGCPAGWVETETRPAQPDRYRVQVPGASTVLITQGALDSAYTLVGTLDTAARDAAIADGTAELLMGAPARSRCRWRPLGGTP